MSSNSNSISVLASAEPGLELSAERVFAHSEVFKFGLEEVQKVRLAPGTQDEVEAHKILEALLDCNATWKLHLRNFIPAHVYIESLPTQASARAEKVFGVSELTEKILGFLGESDLLRAQQVGPHFHDVVNSSPTLQRQLFLKSDEKCYFRFPDFLRYHALLNIPGAEASFHYNPIQSVVSEGEFSVTITLSLSDRLSDWGSRIRDMYICQPPVTTMRYWANCCGGGLEDETGPGGWSIHDTDGIKMGQLYEKAQELSREHKYCLDANEYDYDTCGNVMVQPMFQGTVAVLPDDPAVQGVRSRVASAKHMRRYIAAKRTAHALRQPLLTFADWEAAEEKLKAKLEVSNHHNIVELPGDE